VLQALRRKNGLRVNLILLTFYHMSP